MSTNVFLYEKWSSKPFTKEYLVEADTNEFWETILSDPKTLPKKASIEAFKKGSPAVCGLEPMPGATSRSDGYAVHSLVFDVDSWREDRPPFSLEDLKARLGAFRFIAWNSFSSTKDALRWRVVVPLESPMDPRFYQSLWSMVNEVLEFTVAESQNHPDRLGFFGRTGDESSYTFYCHNAPRLDWNEYELTPTVRLSRDQLPYEAPTLPKEYLSNNEALNSALSYFEVVGAGLKDGEGRRDTLLTALCKSFWEWGLNPDDVGKVANRINDNFTDKKSEGDLEELIHQAFERTLGSKRIEQEREFAWRRAPTVVFSKTALKELSATLKRKRTQEERSLARTINNIYKGTTICEKVERVPLLENTILRLGEVFYRTDAEKILFEIKPSIGATRAESPENVPSDDRILALIIRGQKRGESRVTQREETIDEIRKEKIRSAFLTIQETRDNPYTDAELTKYRKDCALREDRWILQKGKLYYFFLGGKYVGPYTFEEALTMYFKLLSPADQFLKLRHVDEKGRVVERKFQEVLQDYGTVVSEVEIDLTGEVSGYEEYKGTLVQSITPAVKLRARFSQDVEAWLQMICPDPKQYEYLLDYLSMFPDLSKPLPALSLVGPQGSGRSTLVLGLARVFKRKIPVDFDKWYHLPWEITDNPIIHATDDLTRIYQKVSAATVVRQLVLSREHSVFSKISRAQQHSLSGYLRFIASDTTHNISAQIKEILVGRQSTAASIQQKMIVLEFNSKATAFINNEKDRKKKFVEADEIARHVMWLNSNHTPVERNENNVVEAGSEGEENESQTLNKLSATELEKNEICEWIYRWALANNAPKQCGIYAVNDKLYCHSTEMFKAWNTLPGVDQYSQPPPNLGRAIKSLSLKKSSIRVSHKDTPYSVRLMDLAEIEKWVEDHNLELDPLRTAIIERSAREDPEVNVRTKSESEAN